MRYRVFREWPSLPPHATAQGFRNLRNIRICSLSFSPKIPGLDAGRRRDVAAAALVTLRARCATFETLHIVGVDDEAPACGSAKRARQRDELRQLQGRDGAQCTGIQPTIARAASAK